MFQHLKGISRFYFTRLSNGESFAQRATDAHLMLLYQYTLETVHFHFNNYSKLHMCACVYEYKKKGRKKLIFSNMLF